MSDYHEFLRWSKEADFTQKIDDNVNNPPHYTNHPSGIECIQITEHMGFNLGNALKYIWRCDLKRDAVEDLKKSAWYIEREITRRESLNVDDKPKPDSVESDADMKSIKEIKSNEEILANAPEGATHFDIDKDYIKLDDDNWYMYSFDSGTWSLIDVLVDTRSLDDIRRIVELKKLAKNAWAPNNIGSSDH